jgi:uncharacterized membrane protein YoaK (UPF0700 family)
MGQPAQFAESDSIATGAMMAGAGGFLDAFTYVGHGHVFANAMTGNVVLLGVALGSGDPNAATRHAVPIAAFIAGVMFARVLHLPRLTRAIASPHLTCMSIEVLFLFLVGWLPPAFPDQVLTLGIAFVASIQLSTFAKIRGAPYASTFTTGNLRKLAESGFALFAEREDRNARILTTAFAALCTSFLAGAVLGSVATARLGNHAAWIVDAWLAVVTWRLLNARDRSPGVTDRTLTGERGAETFGLDDV